MKRSCDAINIYWDSSKGKFVVRLFLSDGFYRFSVSASSYAEALAKTERWLTIKGYAMCESSEEIRV